VKSYPERLADGADFRECCGTPADPALAMGHADHCAVAAQRAEENRARCAALPEPDGADDGTTGEAVAIVETPRRPQ
jgi:hypothetical protein